MSRIKVGMLVRIIPHPKITLDGQKYIGGVFEVIRESASGLPYWKLAGATDPGDMWWAGTVLEPVDHDKPADEDFQEDLKRWLGEKVTA